MKSLVWGVLKLHFHMLFFPTGVIHEFLGPSREQGAAGDAFIAGLLRVLMQQGGACLWISTSRSIFPPALSAFGLDPERIIFVDLKREKDVLWAMEEALKCNGVAAVIGQLQELSFTQSRKLQLAAGQSNVTGFVLRSDTASLNPTACATRWKITPLPSRSKMGMPGVGFPRWQVELLKVRNGNTGRWDVEWFAGKLVMVLDDDVAAIRPDQVRKAV